MPTVFEKTTPENEEIINPWEGQPGAKVEIDPEKEIAAPAARNDEQDHDDPVKVYLQWIAPARPFRRKDRSYFQTIAIIVGLLILISLLAGELMLVAVLLALCFVAYVI